MTRPLDDIERELKDRLDWQEQVGWEETNAAIIQRLRETVAKRKGEPVPTQTAAVEAWESAQEAGGQVIHHSTGKHAAPVESRPRQAWGHTVATAKRAWEIHPVLAVGAGLVLLAGLAVAFVYVAPLAFLGWLFWLLSTRHRNRTAKPGKPVQKYKRSRVTYGRLKALENQDRIEQQLQRIVVNLNVPDDKDKGGK